MKLLIHLHVLFLLSIGLSSAGTIKNPRSFGQYYQHPVTEQNFLQKSPIYLLITTSSKIYSLQIPANFQFDNIEPASFQTDKSVIYQEQDLANHWITDAFYVKSEDLIYVNVYNSSASSSDIFTLKYNQETNSYVKNVLYKDQSYCLGITYNEAKKELYWTAAKSVIVGSSKPNSTHSVLYELNRAKKILYLKYDSMGDKLYISTLNYVYECDLASQTDFTQSIIYTQRCRIVMRNLISARGLYLDNHNRFLYVVDHKKRNINRLDLRTIDENKPTRSFINQQTMPEIGDVFNMIIYNRSNTDLLIWNTFSGEIKATKMSDTKNVRAIFKTNEYTYSISLMDNSTEEVDALEEDFTTSTTTELSSTLSATRGLPEGWRYVSKDTTEMTPENELYDYENLDEERVISLETKSLNANKDGLVSIGSRKFIVSDDSDTDKLIMNGSSKKLSFLRSSTHLNAALYIVICLLCFSLFINIILLYISKMKHNKSKQLIISHEICDMPKRGGSTTTSKSTSEESCDSSESNECGLNLINSTGNSTSGLDSDR